MSLFRSRVAAAILGAIVVGGASGGLGVLFAAHNMPSGNGSAQGTASAAQAAETTVHATITATTRATSAAPAAAAPTASTAQAPTAAPNPTPTPLTPGEQVSLQGSIGSVNGSANTFVLNQRSGPAVTISVSAATQFQGDATSFSSLKRGWHADVTGIVQADGSVAASVVYATADN